MKTFKELVEKIGVVPEYDDPISRMRKKENEEKRKKNVAEEVEQIDEISQKLKQSYLDKSKEEVKQLKKHMKGEYGGIVKRMIARRNKGIAMASK
jgi:hypothetical protein